MTAKNTLLAVDTSSRVLSVAIRTDHHALFETNLEGAPRHSEQLISVVEFGLNTLKLHARDITQFLWSLGPGSFTGLRIGFSVLKGLSLGLNQKKSFGASSLDVIAAGCPMVSGKLAVCVDARRDRIYAALYQFQGGRIERATKESLVSEEEFLEQLTAARAMSSSTGHELATDGITLTGDALLRYGNAIRKKLGPASRFLDDRFWYPRATTLIHLWDRKREWIDKLPVRRMTPRYLHKGNPKHRTTA